MSLGTLGLAFLAGALSVLSPCVLPLLPIMVGSAASEHRFAPAALAAGLLLSFVVIGLFVATVGFAAGLDTGFFRLVSAILLIAVGTLLLVPRLGAQAAAAGGPVSNWVEGQLGGFATHELGGQFLLACCLERCGALASGRRLAPPRSSRLRARISERWRSPWSPSASARPFRSSPLGSVARSFVALARVADGSRQRWQSLARRSVGRDRPPGGDRARQEVGDPAG
jgi:hypothetical protein